MAEDFNNIDARSQPLTDWKHGDRLAGSADKLNEPIQAIRALLRPSPDNGQSELGNRSYSLPSACRVLLTSVAQAKTGLPTIDGVVLADNDLILVATGAVPGNDGVYRANAFGAWEFIAALNYQQATDTTPVLPHGWVITIWDGASHVGEQWFSGLFGPATF